MGDPLAPENLLKASGRGIFFMRSFMDDVTLRVQATADGSPMVKRLAAHGWPEPLPPVFWLPHRGRHARGGVQLANLAPSTCASTKRARSTS